jgi:hypothetical protein
MARTFVIHRRDMNNLPYVSSDSYNPPNDNRLIDDYGKPKVSISVPISVPSENQSLSTNPPTKFVWAGNEYIVKNITRDQTSSAFNLPKDIKDAALPVSEDYTEITPYFSVNIEATTTSTQRSSSSIVSLAAKTLYISIPVYTQSDFNRMNNTGVESVAYSGTKDTFNNIYDFMKPGSELYGVVLQDETTEIQVIPKRVCVISDEMANTIQKRKWVQVCDKVGKSDMLCRMKNTNEVAGYSQGLVKFIKTDMNVIPAKILVFKSIGFSSDPAKKSIIPNKQPDEIPVELEGEGEDGTTRKYKIVVDEPEKVMSITNTAIVIFSAIVVGLSLLTMTSLSDSSSGYSYYVPRMLLLLLGMIGLPVVATSNPKEGSSLKGVGFSSIILIMIVVLGLMIYNLVSPLYPTLPPMSPGISIVAVLLIFSLMSFVYSLVVNFGDVDPDESNQKRNENVGYYMTYISKAAVLLLLFMTNPSQNMLSISKYTQNLNNNSFTDIDISKGLEKLLNREESPLNITNSDLANALRYVRKDTVGDEEDILTTLLSKDNRRRVYYKKDTDDGVAVKGRLFKMNDNGTRLVEDPTERNVGEGFERLTQDDIGGNPVSITHLIIVGLLVLSLFLILVQPSPTPKTDDEKEKWLDFGVAMGVNIVLFIAIIYLWYKGMFGKLVGIPLVLGIIGNISFKVGLLFQGK